MQNMALIKTLYRNEPDVLEMVRELLASGADPNFETEYGESPLSVASFKGRFDVVEVLLSHGADHEMLLWEPIFFQVAFGDSASIIRCLQKHGGLEECDLWQRTPLLMALQMGAVNKAQTLLAQGAHLDATGNVGATALHYAVFSGQPEAVAWVLQQGADVDRPDDFGYTALMTACRDGFVAGAQLLLQAGANVDRRNHIQKNALQLTSRLDIVQLLLQHGMDFADLSEEARFTMLGLSADGRLQCTRQDYQRHRYPVYGRRNPEQMNNPFWLEMIRTSVSAYRARQHFAQNEDDDVSEQPVWCYQRFGRTTTILTDGRIVEIGGEHEDVYDPDFCIYNDVVVFEQGKPPVVYGYPKNLFPPTDFHTATLVGDAIYIIGNLGYQQARRAGETPVYRLQLADFSIQEVPTTGEKPGWISRHRAQVTADQSAIVVWGGQVVHGGKLTENAQRYRLDLGSSVWGRE